MSDSNVISLSSAIRYFGVNIVASHKFTCSFDNSKRSFYRAFNAIFGKVGRIASEDVIIELLKAKCLPALYYGLEACPVNKSQIRSLEYVLNNTFRKIFATKSFDVATDCVLYFGCAVQDTLCRRKSNFLTKLKYTTSSNQKIYRKSCQTNLSSFRNLRRTALFRTCAYCFFCVVCVLISSLFACILSVCLLLPTTYW